MRNRGAITICIWQLHWGGAPDILKRVVVSSDRPVAGFMPDQMSELPVDAILAPAKARPWFRLRLLTMLIMLGVAAGMIYANSKSAYLVSGGIGGGSRGNQSFNYSYYICDSTWGYPSAFFQRTQKVVIPPDDPDVPELPHYDHRWMPMGLVIDVVVLFAAVALTGIVLEMLLSHWSGWRARSRMKGPHDSLDGEPESPAWDEAKNLSDGPHP